MKPQKEKPAKPASQLVDIPWVFFGLVLSLPTIVFAVVHQVYVPHKLPEILDAPLGWIVTFIGVFGPLMTVAALAVSLAATLQNSVSWKAKAILWTMGVISCVAWMFIVDIPA